MKFLVANIGSTSFKYRLYAMPSETMLARGGVERIGSEKARSYVMRPEGMAESIGPVADHAAAVDACLAQLIDPSIGALASAAELSAIGFKAVHARGISGVQVVDDAVLTAMEEFSVVAPAHNPPYIRAMRQLRQRFAELPLVAAFETGFHQDIPLADRLYAVPYGWYEQWGIQRWGFHGASHRYVAGRMAELLGRTDARVISCHLGGSSSLCAIRAGRSVGTSMGMSPQSGLPHNNRVGDFDPFALPVVMRQSGKSLDEILQVLANESGLAGISGAGNDLRDIEQAAASGNDRARLAIEQFIGSIRDYLGSYLVRLGGADAIAFAGGIGENSVALRQRVCAGLAELGIRLDPERNQSVNGEGCISAADSRTAVWIVPTNEELVVARQTYEKLAGV